MCAIYTPERWGSFGGVYRRAAWEGRFSGYEERGGMRVPGCGEVGWYEGSGWEAVWRGRLTGAEYRFTAS